MNTFRNTILHGDCLHVLPQLPGRSVDFILTDPPYITRYKSRDGRTVAQRRQRRMAEARFRRDVPRARARQLLRELLRLAARRPLHRAYRAAGFRVVGHFAFPEALHVRDPVPALSARMRATCSPRATRSEPRDTIGDVIDWTLHRQQAAPDAEAALGAAAAGGDVLAPRTALVLDPFAGSGSSLLAAKMLGRNYLGIELDAKYHAIASRRLEANA